MVQQHVTDSITYEAGVSWALEYGLSNCKWERMKTGRVCVRIIYVHVYM